MGGLDRRLRKLEQLFGRPIVHVAQPDSEEGDEPNDSADQAPVTSARPLDESFWTDVLLASAWYREVYIPEVERRRDAGEVDADVARTAIAAVTGRILTPDRCSSCGVWPMPSIHVDPDGTVRCPNCGGLHGFLPSRLCGHVLHWANECGYSFARQVEGEWFWPLLNAESRRYIAERHFEGGVFWSRPAA